MEKKEIQQNSDPVACVFAVILEGLLSWVCGHYCSDPFFFCQKAM